MSSSSYYRDKFGMFLVVVLFVSLAFISKPEVFTGEALSVIGYCLGIVSILLIIDLPMITDKKVKKE